MYKKRFYFSVKIMSVMTMYCVLVEGTICLIESINQCDTYRSQRSGTEIGLFFNASQARQFNLIFAWLCWSTDFSTISCSSLGGACVGAAEQLMTACCPEIFSPEIGPCIIKEGDWLTCVPCPVSRYIPTCNKWIWCEVGNDVGGVYCVDL